MVKGMIDSGFSIWLRTKIYPLTMLLSRTKVRYKIIIENDYISKADKPIIFACNHSAFPDIPIALRAVKRHSYTLIGKQNLAFVDRIFFFLVGAIWVDRKSKKSCAYSKESIIAYLKKGKSILWFPEGTWNLTDNLLMLPMRWGIIEVAYRSGAQIIPTVLDYDREKMVCRIRFGDPVVIDNLNDKVARITELRDILSALRWEFMIQKPVMNRATISPLQMRNEMYKVIAEYPPLDWEYESSCIYQSKDIVLTDEAFAHLNKLKPTTKTAFLFNKRLK